MIILSIPTSVSHFVITNNFHALYRYDEFGFRIDDDLDDFNVNGLLFEPFVEDSQWRYVLCIT